jgi:predicted DCC family thiol-disulfide oxidoreductase YuxK
MPVVLFDGVCSFCNAWVRFVIDRDPRRRFAFVSLQSEYGASLLRDHGYRGDPLATVVLIEDGRVYDRSSAALHIARHLSRPWPVVSLLRIIPRGLRDWLYDLVARRRHRWSGRADACGVAHEGETVL